MESPERFNRPTRRSCSALSDCTSLEKIFSEKRQVPAFDCVECIEPDKVPANRGIENAFR
jgi:hypothetical protein